MNTVLSFMFGLLMVLAGFILGTCFGRTMLFDDAVQAGVARYGDSGDIEWIKDGVFIPSKGYVYMDAPYLLGL